MKRYFHWIHRKCANNDLEGVFLEGVNEKERVKGFTMQQGFNS